MKQAIKVFLYMELARHWDGISDYPQEKTWKPDLWTCKVDESEERIFVGETTLQVEYPDGFDPLPRQLAALEKERLVAIEAYQSTMRSINERLSKLQALGDGSLCTLLEASIEQAKARRETA